MNLEIPDDDLDLVITALERYHACTVAKNAEDARYRDLADRRRRKPAERAPVGGKPGVEVKVTTKRRA
jgi:hypothetical protein